ncbi:SprT family zinc-dependent metalloprotease [Maribacter stanieri]|uniref:M48 family metallopeptidase n=1 Tax=Maribacter stanieri TaxID=440514 RepID=UPI0030D9D860|tara:strand:+ start:14075 stop:14788 length:714 start_codon:yes stop_codon:yes gene_type:complete
MSIKEAQIQVLDLTIDIVKKDIKNMHLAVYPPTGRIRIASPKDVNDEAIRLFAISKIRWIKKHQKNFYEQLREAPREYITGESHYFDGKRYLLKVIERYGKHELKVKNKNYLELYVSPKATIEAKEKVFNEWYRVHLKEIVPNIIKAWEEKTGLNCEHWDIKKMRTRWGSCNIEKQKILLNLELAKKPRHCLEYVIVHELMHFFERNHNDHFKGLLDKFMPNWKTYKRELDNLPIAY